MIFLMLLFVGTNVELKSMVKCSAKLPVMYEYAMVGFKFPRNASA